MDSETIIRLAVFIALFAGFATWEALQPRRRRSLKRSLRWASNLGLAAINTVATPLLVPMVAIGMAVVVQDRGWGLFNYYDAPYILAVAGSVIVLDFVIYLQHVMFHSVPVLWRLHRVHHSDVDLDVSSGIRFHIIEILISMLIKVSAIAALGAPVLGVLIFEVLLNATAMFNHANIRLPQSVDKLVRLFLVTPDMHRVHHSAERIETDSNYGFNLPWWDYLCGTYRAQPSKGHENMTIGLDVFRGERDQYLDRLLVQPFLPDGTPDAQAHPSEVEAQTARLSNDPESISEVVSFQS